VWQIWRIFDGYQNISTSLEVTVRTGVAPRPTAPPYHPYQPPGSPLRSRIDVVGVGSTNYAGKESNSPCGLGS